MQGYRDLAMILLGALGVLTYQKYKKPICNKIDEIMDMTVDEASEKLKKLK